MPSLVLLLLGCEGDRCIVLARVSADLIGRKIHAHELVREVASLLGGKGGGKADAAQGVGGALEKIPEAMRQAERWILSKSI